MVGNKGQVLPEAAEIKIAKRLEEWFGLPFAETRQFTAKAPDMFAAERACQMRKQGKSFEFVMENIGTSRRLLPKFKSMF